MHKYKDLRIWEYAMEIVTEVYRLTKDFPEQERFILVSQIRRAAISIPSNIAEGAGRNSDKEFLQFLAIAHASSFEVETQLLISKNLGYLSDDSVNVLTEKITEWQKMSYGFQATVRSRITNI